VVVEVVLPAKAVIFSPASYAGVRIVTTKHQKTKMTRIPNDINQVFEELKREIIWLHGRWIIYRQLFAESRKRLDLLNECASSFFYIVQDVLYGEIQVSLSKLSDPAHSGKFKNLSLEQLQLQLEFYGDKHLATGNRLILDELHLKCEPFRLWRNKRLAHLDLDTAMKVSPDPLPGISRQMIEDALELIRRYMNQIEGQYDDSETAYQYFAMRSDGDALVSVLRDGLRYRELSKEKVIPFDDRRHGKWHGV